ncbi:hypothetical protein Ocin01_13827 [Orchesella cincta]|uniref:Uncharacterized protein n=1 Tax=Orchesella cincta TaxID=48709 RepID=A0A1D2MIN0_ORCCI|nr:hypothetical protein Ocin01_13827 [Orchesella cincta]
MNKFIILAAVAAVAVGEAPAHVGLSGGYSGGGGSSGGSSGGSGINEYVDEALLARVSALISSGGDGTGTPQGSEGRNLDANILARVSGSLGDGGSSSGPSSSYGPHPVLLDQLPLDNPSLLKELPNSNFQTPVLLNNNKEDTTLPHLLLLSKPRAPDMELQLVEVLHPGQSPLDAQSQLNVLLTSLSPTKVPQLNVSAPDTTKLNTIRSSI